MTGRRSFLAALAAVLVSLSASAGIDEKAGTATAQFLRLEMGGRHAALGGSYAGYGDEATTWWGQPAAIGEMDRFTASFQHTEHFQGITQEYVGLGLPFGSHKVGVSVNFLQVEDLLRTTEDALGSFTGSSGFFDAADLGVALHYGRELTERLSVGVAGRYIKSEIDDVDATGFGFDAGARYRVSEGFTLGASVTNAGRGLKFIRKRDDLPTTFRVGASWERQGPLGWGVLLAGDVWKGVDTDFEFGGGVELWPVELVGLRVGYRSAGAEVGEGLTAGLGMKWQGLNLDYAYVPFGELGDAHRVSATVRWGGGGGGGGAEGFRAPPSPEMERPLVPRYEGKGNVRRK